MPFVNSACLFVSYLIVRIFIQTYLSFGFAYYHFYYEFISYDTQRIISKGKDPLKYLACGFFMLVVNLLSQIINYYWFTLICKQVYRNYEKATGKSKGEEVDLMREHTDRKMSDKKDN